MYQFNIFIERLSITWYQTWLFKDKSKLIRVNNSLKTWVITSMWNRLSGSWFVNHDKVLNFHNWILCYCEPFHSNVKKKQTKKMANNFYILEVKIIVRFVSYKYANVYYLWILSTPVFVDFIFISCIDFFFVV